VAGSGNTSVVSDSIRDNVGVFKSVLKLPVSICSDLTRISIGRANKFDRLQEMLAAQARFTTSLLILHTFQGKVREFPWIAQKKKQQLIRYLSKMMELAQLDT
jgi:hypothetical protein